MRVEAPAYATLGVLGQSRLHIIRLVSKKTKQTSKQKSKVVSYLSKTLASYFIAL